MLKLFRKYSKWMLAIFGSFLMIVFVFPPDFGRGGGASDFSVGTYDGGKISQADLRAGRVELEIIQSVGRGTMAYPTDESGGLDTLTWELMKIEARQLGIEVSDYHVDAILLDGALQLSDAAALQNMANRFGVSSDFVRNAFRNWLMVMQYQELALGRTHMPAIQRIGLRANALQYAMQLQQNPFMAMMSPQMPQLIQSLDQTSYGAPRASEPLLQRTLYDDRATVKMKAIRIAPEEYFDEVEIDQAKVKELFDEYKDDLKGSTEPYGFGYKYPNRVKLEYLVIPIDRLAEKVREEGIDDREIFKYYQDNKFAYIIEPDVEESTDETEEPEETDEESTETSGDESTSESDEEEPNSEAESADDGPTSTEDTDPSGQPEETTGNDSSDTDTEADADDSSVEETENGTDETAENSSTVPDVEYRPFAEVYDEIEDLLVNQKAVERADEMSRAILAMLGDDARQLPADPNHSQYKDTGDFMPMPFAEVAEKIAAEDHFVRPDIVRLDREWLDAVELNKQRGINRTALGRMPFVQYILQTKTFALDRPEEQRMAGVRLQAKLPSEPLQNFQTRDRYIFRIIEAQLAHEPKSLDEVKDAVEEDAKKLAAYELLKERAERWRQLLINGSTDIVGNAAFAQLVETKYKERIAADILKQVKEFEETANVRNKGPHALAIDLIRTIVLSEFEGKISEDTRSKIIELCADAIDKDQSAAMILNSLITALNDGGLDGSSVEELVIDLATDVSELYLDPPPFARREQNQIGQTVAPNVPGLGQSEEFVDALFEVASDLSEISRVENMPREDRVNTVPLEARQSLYIVEITDFQAMTGKQYRDQVSQAASIRLISAEALSVISEEGIKRFDVDALKKRLNYKDVDGGDSDEETAETDEDETDEEPSTDE